MASIRTKLIFQFNQFSNNFVVKTDPSVKITKNHSHTKKIQYYCE